MNENAAERKNRIIPASKRLRAQFDFTRVPNEIIEHPGLSMQAKMVWIELWKFCFKADGQGAFPGMERVANDLNVSEDTIRRHRRRLEEEGLLEVQQRGLTKTNIYHLFTPEKVQENPEPANIQVQEPVETQDEEDKDLIKQEKQKSKDMQQAAKPSKKKKSLKGFSLNEIVALHEKDITCAPEGFTRPQMLAGVLDHKFGFTSIVEDVGWKDIMLRLGQLYNKNRKVTLAHEDIMATAIEMKYIPHPRDKPPNLNYLIAVLTRESQKRMSERAEAKSDRYKEQEDNTLSGLAQEFGSVYEKEGG